MDINIDFEIDTLTESIEEATRLLPALIAAHIEATPDIPYVLDEDVIESVLVIARDANNEVRLKVLDAIRDLIGDATDNTAVGIQKQYDDVIEFYVRKTLNESATRIQSASVARQILPDQRQDSIDRALESSVSRATIIGTTEILASAALFDIATSIENGFSYFRYETSDDEVVRDSHNARDGKIFRYGSERVADDVPGLAHQCRCFSFPLTDEEVLNNLDNFFYPEDGFKGVQNNVEVTGTVGDYYEYNDFASFKSKVEMDLDGSDESELVLDITSHGGYAYDGLAAYSYLSSLPNKIVANVYGFAGSAATAFIAAADHVTADEADQILIHGAWTMAVGGSEDLRKTADELEVLDASLVKAYQRKTGRTEEEIKALMEEDAYISAERALEFGLVDEIRKPKEMAKAKEMPLAQAVNTTKEDFMSDKERAQLEQDIAKTKIAAQAEMKAAVDGAKDRVKALGVEAKGDSLEEIFANAAKDLDLYQEGYEEAQIMASINTFEKFSKKDVSENLGSDFLAEAGTEDKKETRAEKFERLNKESK